jgi:hypothetical protein
VNGIWAAWFLIEADFIYEDEHRPPMMRCFAWLCKKRAKSSMNNT